MKEIKDKKYYTFAIVESDDKLAAKADFILTRIEQEIWNMLSTLDNKDPISLVLVSIPGDEPRILMRYLKYILEDKGYSVSYQWLDIAEPIWKIDIS